MSEVSWLVWEVAVFVLFVLGTTCAPLLVRRRPTVAAGGAKHAYVFAGGGVSMLAMVLSLARGTLGVRSFIGYPAELVYYGAAMWETLYGLVLALPLVAWLLLPLYWRLHTTSVYEYLQRRFESGTVRRLAAATFLLRQLLNLAVTAYTPCVALHAVLGVPLWASASVLCAATAAAAVLGGLAAAVRADALQTGAMVLVSLAFLVQAVWRAGGPGPVLSANLVGERLRLLRLTGDPRTRVDTSSALLGQLFMSVSVYGCQQTFVQRYVSLGSLKRARRTLLLAAPAVALLFSLSWLVGMALYALYRDCDPLAAGRIAVPDEVLPFYVRDQFAFLPGMMGFFLGCLFNGALSFLVSNVNSLATVTWEDFVSATAPFRGVDDAQQLRAIKVIAVIYAALIAGLSLCVGMVGGVVEGSLLVTSATSGALLGVFILAAACPLAHGRAAIAGMLAAHALTVTMAVGRLAYSPAGDAMLPLSTAGCVNSSLPLPPGTRAPPGAVLDALQLLGPLLRDAPTPPPPSALWAAAVYVCSVSYMWYGVLGTLTCVLVGNVVGALSPTDAPLDERLLHPAAARVARALGCRRLRAPDAKERPPAPPSPPLPPAALPPAPPTAPPPPLVSAAGSRLFDAYVTSPR